MFDFDKKDILVFKESAGKGYERSEFYGDNYYDELPDSGYWSGPENNPGPNYEAIVEMGQKAREEGIPPDEAERFAHDNFSSMKAVDAFIFGYEGKPELEFDEENSDAQGPAYKRLSVLSYDHNTWNGYITSKNDRPEDDEFSKRLKGISRGR